MLRNFVKGVGREIKLKVSQKYIEHLSFFEIQKLLKNRVYGRASQIYIRSRKFCEFLK